jgi:hypothetical protein
MEFKAFPKIERFKGLHLVITQKIHGSNAQVLIKHTVENIDPTEVSMGMQLIVDGKEFTLMCGSRNRWITPGHDNFGFAQFVYNNAEEFIRCLGVGQHFGEWAGPGINSGEGLTEKKFVLFDYWKFPPERVLPPGCVVVPVLYDGRADLDMITTVFNWLKETGSQLVPGYMKPEGIVITLNNVRYKKVFDAEEVAWKGQSKPKAEMTEVPDYGYLLQPMRLEKLLSRDEKYIIGYPKTLGEITKDYIWDLMEDGIDVDTKELSRQVFPFVRDIVDNQYMRINV